jgi:hypothetical protein
MFTSTTPNDKPEALKHPTDPQRELDVDCTPVGQGRTRYQGEMHKLTLENEALKMEIDRLKATPFLPSELRLFAGAADAIENRTNEKKEGERRNYRRGLSGSMSAIDLEQTLIQEQNDKIEAEKKKEDNKLERERKKLEKEKEKEGKRVRREQKKREREALKAQKEADRAAKRTKSN